MNTGQRLKQLREEKGLSQEEVAKLIGVGRTTYLKYESGENRPVRKLDELTRLFNVSSDYIMGLSPERSPHAKNNLAQDQSLPPLTKKDEREIARDLENMLNSLDGAAGMGDAEDEEDLEMLKASLETAMRLSKRIAKKKFTPKKYRKE